MLKAEDVLDIADELAASMTALADGLSGLDLDDLIAHTRDGNMREIFLAAAEFKASMAPVLARRQTWH